MNKETIKQYQREFFQHVQWDPAEEGLEPFVEIERSKALHSAKRYLTELGHKEEFEAASKLTLYKTLSTFYFGDVVAMMAGVATPHDLLDQVGTKSKAKLSKYEFVFGPTKETVNKWREAQKILVEVGGVHVVETSMGSLVVPEGASKTAIDTLLASEKLPSIEEIISGVGKAEVEANEQGKKAKAALKAQTQAEAEVERLSAELTTLTLKSLASGTAEVEVEGDGSIPNGKLVHKNVSDLFPNVDVALNFEVPYWEWDGPHPNVPKVDEHYIFRADLLSRVLYAIVTNERAYLQGHTGSGKTTLIEQVCAHLNYPFVRINFDSEITRMDLIGRDVLTTDDKGNTVSSFIDGMLPRAMSMPCILCCDEIDFVRPDVAYVMQSALEGNGLRITEDGDRLVKPDPNMRMFATGNTVGQGDEHGMYQGARPQSLALLDRFTVWCKVGYLTEQERENLVARHYPMLKDEDLKKICKYTTEHLASFEQQDITQPISPRGMLALAQGTLVLGSFKEAVKMSCLDKANEDDRSHLTGIVDRVA